MPIAAARVAGCVTGRFHEDEQGRLMPPFRRIVALTGSAIAAA